MLIETQIEAMVLYETSLIRFVNTSVSGQKEVHHKDRLAILQDLRKMFAADFTTDKNGKI